MKTSKAHLWISLGNGGKKTSKKPRTTVFTGGNTSQAEKSLGKLPGTSIKNGGFAQKEGDWGKN